jgi:hypothetical protein
MNLSDSDFQAWMGEVQARMESALVRLLPAAHIAPARLHEAMRYAALEGGKRVRPLLAFAAWTALSFARVPQGWHWSGLAELPAYWPWRGARVTGTLAAGALFGIAGTLLAVPVVAVVVNVFKELTGPDVATA